MMESYKQNKSFYSELKCQKKKRKRKTAFYSLGGRERQSPRPITREKQKTNSTQPMYTMNERNETVYQEFLLFSNISLFPLEKISTVSCFGFCLFLLVVNVSEKETARERERDSKGFLQSKHSTRGGDRRVTTAMGSAVYSQIRFDLVSVAAATTTVTNRQLDTIAI
jgi:nitrate reductase NapE component